MSQASDAELLQEAVTEAGQIAMRYFKRDPENWTKNDVSPVSEADIAVDTFLRERLLSARPDYGWLSEETEDDPSRLSRKRVWIVDPIDGTRAFLDGKPEFTVCAGLAVDGEIVAAAIDNPAMQESFVAEKGAGALMNGEELKIGGGPALSEARILARRNVFKLERWQGDLPDTKRGYVGSLAYQVCHVAAGRWDAAIAVNRLHEWDIAAADLILTEAGGRVTDQTGAPIHYNCESPKVNGMIVAGLALHSAIASELVPKPH